VYDAKYVVTKTREVDIKQRKQTTV